MCLVIRKEKSCWCQEERKENFKNNGWFPSYNFSLVQQVYVTVWSLSNTLYLSGLACSTTLHPDTPIPTGFIWPGWHGRVHGREQQCWRSGWPFLYTTRSYLVPNTTQHRQHATEKYRDPRDKGSLSPSRRQGRDIKYKEATRVLSCVPPHFQNESQVAPGGNNNLLTVSIYWGLLYTRYYRKCF